MIVSLQYSRTRCTNILDSRNCETHVGGLRHPDWPKTGKEKNAKSSDPADGKGDAEQSAGLSASLVESLTAH